MKKILVVITLITILTLIGCGRRGLIMGKVVNENNEPVIGALVTSDPPTISVLTTSEGFAIKNVTPGIYSVTARKEGFSTRSVEVKVSPKRKIYADIQIKTR